MAPVTVTTTGILRQPIDDSELVALIETLSSYATVSGIKNDNHNDYNGLPSIECSDIDIEGLVGELEIFDDWRFTEQVRWFYCTFQNYATII